jgi:hypothetical protein
LKIIKDTEEYGNCSAGRGCDVCVMLYKRLTKEERVDVAEQW